VREEDSAIFLKRINIVDDGGNNWGATGILTSPDGYIEKE